MYSRAELGAHLRDLGVVAGETLLVQSSARAVGPVDGGSTAIVAAIRDALGPEGTVVVYTATPENSNTSPLYRAATAGLDPAGLRAFRATMPAFDPVRTPASRTLGRIAEEVRSTPGAVRSAHPQTSFAAVGPAAEELMADHLLACHLGEQSPTYRLYRAGVRALLIGVPFWCCTPFHLAEYWQPVLPPMQRYGCVVTDELGRRQWVHFDDLPLTDEHFAVMGDALAEQMTDLVKGPFGDAPCFLFPIAEGVDLATKWLLNRAG